MWGPLNNVCLRPWYRIGAYLVGMLAAIAWLRYREAILDSGRDHTLSESARPHAQADERILIACVVFLHVGGTGAFADLA